MTRISAFTGGFSGYRAMSRSFAAAAAGASEYAGSTMLFIQASAPTGWTKVTTYNDYALRIVSGTASSGGATNFSSAFTSFTTSGTTAPATLGAATDGTTLSTSTIPDHTHTFNAQTGMMANQTTPTSNKTGFTNAISTDVVSPITGQPHNHPAGDTVNSTFSGSSLNVSVKYLDSILATRT